MQEIVFLLEEGADSLKVIFIFVDGFGIGAEDKSINPLYAAKTSVLRNLVENAAFQADATLGVPGLPQSATGQTALFTGVNAPKVLNRHMSGQPTVTLKKLLYKNNLFMSLKDMGLSVASSNIYRDEYIEKILDVKDRKNRPSVTSVMCMASAVPFRNSRSFHTGEGVYHDITGKKLVECGYDIKAISPQKAAENLYNLSRKYDLTLFEHFVTDIAGHKAEMQEAVKIIETLDSFLETLIDKMNFEEDVLILTSDHGNIEDLSVNTHSMNKVPVIILGKKANTIDMRINSLTDVMPFVLKLFEANASTNGV